METIDITAKYGIDLAIKVRDYLPMRYHWPALLVATWSVLMLGAIGGMFYCHPQTDWESVPSALFIVTLWLVGLWLMRTYIADWWRRSIWGYSLVITQSTEPLYAEAFVVQTPQYRYAGHELWSDDQFPLIVLGLGGISRQSHFESSDGFGMKRWSIRDFSLVEDWVSIEDGYRNVLSPTFDKALQLMRMHQAGQIISFDALVTLTKWSYTTSAISSRSKKQRDKEEKWGPN